MIAFALLLLGSEPDATARAKAAEEAAFAAIERKEWCTAMHLFLDADASAPSADFLMNAAMAAEYAGDRAAARAVYARLLGQSGPRSADVKARVAALQAAIKKQGEGSACPAPIPPLAPGPSQAPAAAEPTAPPSSSQVPTPAEPAADPSPSVVPFAVLGSGAAVTALGAALVVGGALPWFKHAGAVSALQEAEASASEDAAALSALQREQSDARASWESWGRLLVVIGGVVSGVGVAAVAVGGGLFAMGAE